MTGAPVMTLLSGAGRAPLSTAAVAVCLVASALGCRDTVAPRLPSTLTAASATTQDVIAGQAAGQAPAVLVSDARGAPVAGVSIIFVQNGSTAKPFIVATGP